MAILDARTEFSDGQAMSGAAGTINSTNVVDMTLARDLGNGQPVYVVFTIITAPTGADSCKFQVVSDGTATIQTDGTQTIHVATDDIPIASLVDGTQIVLTLPSNSAEDYERYLAVQQVNVGAGALADLVIDAHLTLDPVGWKAYADAAN